MGKVIDNNDDESDENDDQESNCDDSDSSSNDGTSENRDKLLLFDSDSTLFSEYNIETCSDSSSDENNDVYIYMKIILYLF